MSHVAARETPDGKNAAWAGVRRRIAEWGMAEWDTCLCPVGEVLAAGAAGPVGHLDGRDLARDLDRPPEVLAGQQRDLFLERQGFEDGVDLSLEVWGQWRSDSHSWYSGDSQRARSAECLQYRGWAGGRRNYIATALHAQIAVGVPAANGCSMASRGYMTCIP